MLLCAAAGAGVGLGKPSAQLWRTCGSFVYPRSCYGGADNIWPPHTHSGCYHRPPDTRNDPRGLVPDPLLHLVSLLPRSLQLHLPQSLSLSLFIHALVPPSTPYIASDPKMSTTATIRFPPPPPTRNELTSEQRAKLIRTNNKLGQVLGSTPHVLDLTYRGI